MDEVRRNGHSASLNAGMLELEALGRGDVAEGPDPLLRRLILRCRERLARKPRLALDARLAAGGAEPDTLLSARLGMKLNTFLQNVGRARKALAECLRRGGVAVEEVRP